MSEAVNFQKISGDEKFREFLARPFAGDMLYPVFGKLSCETLFRGWTGKDMRGWYRFTGENGDILEFYPEGTYVAKIMSTGQAYQRKVPKTVGDFIRDMDSYGIDLFLNDSFTPQTDCGATSYNDRDKTRKPSKRN